jgi:FkbM family methyltransferase
MTAGSEVRRTEFVINEIHADDVTILIESMLNPWGDDDDVVEAILAGNYPDAASVRLWTLLAQKAGAGEIMVDVGAYTGIFSMVAARASWVGKIVAFEPSAVTYGRLVQNIKLNDASSRVVPCNLAVTSAGGMLSMPHRWGHYTLCSGDSIEEAEHDHTQPAFGIPLDSLMQPSPSLPYLNSKSNSVWPFNRVAAIKIDVEGAELDVLESARALVARDRPVIIAEALSGKAGADLAEFAQGVNYNIRRIGNEWNFALYSPDDTVAQELTEGAIARPTVLRGVRRLRYGI